jgi:coupling of ubiquitin conjugation to ER degradation protein 1
MFPQIARRTIMWDLQRNGGSVAATTERILSGRGLETASLPGFTHPLKIRLIKLT